MSIVDTVERLERNMDEFPLGWELSKYSNEERRILSDLCKSIEEKRNWFPRAYTHDVTFIENVRIPIISSDDDAFMLSQTSLLEKIWEILKKPIEDIPLLINEYKDIDIRSAFVKWRLKIGK